MLRRGLLSSVGDKQEWRLPDWHRLRLMAVLRRNESGLGFNAEMGQIQRRKHGRKHLQAELAFWSVLCFVPSLPSD